MTLVYIIGVNTASWFVLMGPEFGLIAAWGCVDFTIFKAHIFVLLRSPCLHACQWGATGQFSGHQRPRVLLCTFLPTFLPECSVTHNVHAREGCPALAELFVATEETG